MVFAYTGVEIILKDRTGYVRGRISYQDEVFHGAALSHPSGDWMVAWCERNHAKIRALLARRIALNSFILLVCSFLLGALILQFYGISIPILRVAGGLIVAVSGWKLLNDGSQ